MNICGKRKGLLVMAALPVLALSMACAAMTGPDSETAAAEQDEGLDEAGGAMACGPFDKDWHFLAGCLRSIRDDWARASGDERLKAARNARETVERALADRRTSYAAGARMIDRSSAERDYLEARAKAPRAPELFIYQANQLGQPYNGMGQSGMAYFLVHFAQLAAKTKGAEADESYYRSAAEGILHTVLAPSAKGGLTSQQTCRADRQRQCAWFHSITRRDKPADFGVTLNQTLHVLRDLGSIADIYERNGWELPADIDAHIAAGLNQLFVEEKRRSSGDLPTMADYLTPAVGAANVRWLYYGFNRERPGGAGGYFLGRNGKDCGYQVHVLDLTKQVLKRARQKAIWNDAQAFSCNGPLAQAWRGTQIRMSSADPAQWSEPRFPKDTSCKPKHVAKYRSIAAYYDKAFASCGL